MKDSIRKNFSDLQKKFSEQASEFKSEYNLFSWLRVALFVIVTIGLVSFANQKNGPAILITLVLGVLGYLILLKKHASLRLKLGLSKALEEVNSNELKRLDNDLKDFADGKQFYRGDHPYHEDLDVFGRHSLFQLINRTSTFLGERILVKWLSAPTEKEEVEARQKSIKELTPDIAFRQNFQAHGIADKSAIVDHQPLLDWLEKEHVISGKMGLKLALGILPIAMITTIVLSAMGLVQTGVPVLIGFVNIAILGSVFKKLVEVTKSTEVGYKALQATQYHIEMIEGADFKSPKLVALKQKIVHNGVKASKTIRDLRLILDNLQNRVNLLYGIFDILLLLDVFWYLRVMAWKEKNQADIALWFDTLGELDALMSLAGFAYAHPDFAFPTLSEKAFSIKAKSLGHPLIKASKRVSNNFEFEGRGGICLVTGSNMSGKSTFLRTVGVNCVLAQMGAPVCAEEMTLGKLNVFTSMRSQDDLEENVSSFYAELKRLKQLLSSIDGKTPVLFMIDEVLKGTNSEDRHKGALALIKQLNSAYAFGFVSTHDIELGNITNELSDVKNYSFNSEIIGDEIRFDYTLTEGICKSFNATKLMQKMGIEIPE